MKNETAKIGYLSDGRKVSIVGKLNNEETIVQEIFITKDGDEIPSGERFVTKSIHSQPVLSYKEKRCMEIEEIIVRLRHDADKASEDLLQKRNQLDAMKKMLSCTTKVSEFLKESELKILSSFLAGTIEYVVVDRYTFRSPVKMDEFLMNWESEYGTRRYHGLKLASVFGSSGGDLEYRIHQYSDGSGGSYRIYPFTNLKDALQHIKNKAEEEIEKSCLSEDDYKKCIEMGIVFSKQSLEKYKKYMTERILKNLEHFEKEKKRIADSITATSTNLKEIKKI